MSVTTSPVEEIAEQYVRLLLRALRRLPESTVATRRALYDRAHRAQKEAFSPGIEPEEADFQLKLLRTTVRFLENDIRAGLDVFDDSYFPDGLQDAAGKLGAARDIQFARKRAIAAKEARKANRAAPADDTEMSPEIAQSLRVLRVSLATLDTPAPLQTARQALLARARTIWALLILQFQMIGAESRIAVIWLLISPAVLLILISSAYFLMETHFILNMDVPTFALIGSATWIMVRQVIFRASSGLVHSRALINLPPVRPFNVALTQAIIYFVIYLVVLTLLLLFGRMVGWTSSPDDLLGFMIQFVGMWLIGLELGLIFGAITAYWPFFLRLAPVIERGLQLFSSVFFVTEQLPEEYRGWILWCPTAHGIQLLRQAYFPGYNSTDASPAYFWGSIAVLGVIALSVARKVTPKIAPV